MVIRRPLTGVFGGWMCAVSFCAAHAEITLDGTLGPGGLLDGPDVVIPDTVGQRTGANLFHSFSSFNVPAGESATFTGPIEIDNVIARVTGDGVSLIDGSLRSTVPSADLYLINPNGVLFGRSAHLDVDGSFFASSADALLLGPDGRFDARSPGASSLSTAPPSAFGFTRGDTGPVVVDHTLLSAPRGEALSLVGGDVTILGTRLNSDGALLAVDGGAVNIVSAGSPGEVTIMGRQLSAGSLARHGDVTMVNSAVNVSGATGGAIHIRGGEVFIETTELVSGTVSGNGGDIRLQGDQVLLSGGAAGDGLVGTFSFGTGTGGDIFFDAAEVRMVDSMRVRTETRGTANGGDIVVGADTFAVLGGSNLETRTHDAGRSGDIIIDADRITVAGLTSSTTNIQTVVVGPFFFGDYGDLSPGASGEGGDITMNARDVQVLSGGRIQARTYGTGKAGDFSLETHTLLVDGSGSNRSTRIGLTVGDGDIPPERRDVIGGDGGNVSIVADSAEIRALGIIDATTFGVGDAGDIDIAAGDLRLVSDGEFGRRLTGVVAQTNGPGSGGDVRITAGKLEIREGAEVNVKTFSPGDAGSMTITAQRLELRSGAQLDASSVGAGRGGNARVEAERLFISSDGTSDRTFTGITSSAFDAGDAGDLSVGASEIIMTDRGQIASGTVASGSGGDVTVRAGRLRVEDGASISAGTSGPGRGGTVSVRAGDVELRNAGEVSTESTGLGTAGDILIVAAGSLRSGSGTVSTAAIDADGGDITIEVIELVDLLDSAVTTSVQGGTGTGGNISIDPRFVILQNSQVIANAFGGPGGNISIVADSFLVDGNSLVQASSALGIDGTVSVDSPDTDVSGALAVLPAEFVDAAARLAAHCAARRGEVAARFVGVGRGGVPRAPGEQMPAYYATGGAATTAPAVRDRPSSLANAANGFPLTPEPTADHSGPVSVSLVMDCRV